MSPYWGIGVGSGGRGRRPSGFSSDGAGGLGVGGGGGFAGIGTSVRSETLDQFKATVKSDRAKWAEIVKVSGAKID